MEKITKYIWMLCGVLLVACSSKIDDIRPSANPVILPTTGVYPLESEQDLDILMNQIGNAKYVLLGEASHGTSEFYTWRAAITRRLIQEKGFNQIGVEGDWPAAYEVNRYIRGAHNAGSATAVLQSFQRWPTWMWANQEIAELTEWLRNYNKSQAANQVGFYGLDMYSLWESLEAIKKSPVADAATLAAVRNAQSCLALYNQDEQAYAQATTRGTNCAEAIASVLAAVRNRKSQLPAGHAEAFNAEQNALVAVNAERYYQAMMRSGASSWNIRDRHMMETINRLTNEQGNNNAKIIIWEHNTHVGDSRYTDMAAAGEINVGQLVHEQHGSAGVYVVGFGTYEGSVMAASYWGSPIAKMNVPAAQPNSWEAVLHQIAPGNKIINLQMWRNDKQLTQRWGHRAIGVVYNPGRESGNYVHTDLPNRYDAFIFLDRTQALQPLEVSGSAGK